MSRASIFVITDSFKYSWFCDDKNTECNGALDRRPPSTIVLSVRKRFFAHLFGALISEKQHRVWCANCLLTATAGGCYTTIVRNIVAGHNKGCDMAFKRGDYMSIKEIAALWGFSHDAAMRWATKYADRDAVEVHGGAYYVHKEEVLLWKHTYDEIFLAQRLAHVPFKKLHELVASRRVVA